jgi:hypothetical protein
MLSVVEGEGVSCAAGEEAYARVTGLISPPQLLHGRQKGWTHDENEQVGSLALVAVLREQWWLKRPFPYLFPYEDQGEQGAAGVREPDVDGKMDWCLRLARRTHCLLKLGVVVAERGKVAKVGHLQVVTVTWARQVKNSSILA